MEGARPGGRKGFGLPRIARITASGEIRALFRRGKRKRTRHLDVFVSTSPVSHSRLGLVVPKHKQTAVRRNRLKRRLREAGRRELLPRLDAGGCTFDVLIRARPEAYVASYESLRTEMVRLAEELCSSAS
ncbi:MAG TPA: ribonuclease P protein component [Longimicrobiaceae bacterium]